MPGLWLHIHKHQSPVAQGGHCQVGATGRKSLVLPPAELTLTIAARMSRQDTGAVGREEIKLNPDETRIINAISCVFEQSRGNVGRLSQWK